MKASIAECLQAIVNRMSMAREKSKTFVFHLEQTDEIVYCHLRMTKIINEMRLFLLAIALPALFVVAGGIRLLWIGWCTSRAEALAELQSDATEYVNTLIVEAEKRGFHHGPPSDRHRDSHRPPRPLTARPPNVPPHRWSSGLLDELPALCDAVDEKCRPAHESRAFAVYDADGTVFYATPDYPAASALVAEAHLPPPFGEGFLRLAPADGGAAIRARAYRLLAVGAALLIMLVCTLSAGGILLVRGLRRERRDARRKTDFIDNVSHELKTPLAGIRLNAELLAEGRISDEAKRKGAIDAILVESDRLSRMVTELLDFSRLEKGIRRYNLETFDLAAFAAQDAEVQAVSAISHGRARITVKGTGTLVTADKDAIRQIATNLVTNAIKYSDGEIEIEVEGNDIRFMDRGPGIPSGAEDRIFERFYRIDNSLTRTASGMGIGLPISRALARGMGGDLTYSRRPGGGSVFTLTLKRAN